MLIIYISLVSVNISPTLRALNKESRLRDSRAERGRDSDIFLTRAVPSLHSVHQKSAPKHYTLERSSHITVLNYS